MASRRRLIAGFFPHTHERGNGGILTWRLITARLTFPSYTETMLVIRDRDAEAAADDFDFVLPGTARSRPRQPELPNNQAATPRACSSTLGAQRPVHNQGKGDCWQSVKVPEFSAH